MLVKSPPNVPNAHLVLLVHSRQPDGIMQPLLCRLAQHLDERRLWMAVVACNGHARFGNSLLYQGIRAMQRGAGGVLILPLFEPVGHVRHVMALQVMQLNHRYGEGAVTLLPPVSGRRLHSHTLARVIRRSLCRASFSP